MRTHLERDGLAGDALPQRRNLVHELRSLLLVLLLVYLKQTHGDAIRVRRLRPLFAVRTPATAETSISPSPQSDRRRAEGARARPTEASAASVRQRASDAEMSHSARFAMAISQKEMWCRLRYWFWLSSARW